MNGNIRQIIFFMIGPFIAKLFSFISLPIISYYISLKEFGAFTAFTILVMYFTPLVTLGTEQYYLRIYKPNTGEHIRKILFRLFFSIFFMGMVLTFFATLLGYEVLFNMPSYFWYLGFITALFTSLQDIYVRTVRSHGLGEVYSIMTFINQLSMFVITVTLVIKYQSLFALIIATCLSAFINFVFNKCIFNKYIRKLENTTVSGRPVSKLISEALKYSIPLLPAVFLWILQSSIDRFIISEYLGEEVLGIFGVALKFGTIVSLFVTSFLIFWEPKIYIYYDEFKDTLNFREKVTKYKDLYSIFIQCIIVGLFLFLPLLIKTLSTEYQEAMYIIPLVVLQLYIHGFSYFSGFGPQLTKKTIHSLYPLVFSVLINISLSLILVKKLQLAGVIIAANSSFVMLLIMNYWISNKLLKYNVSIGKDLIKVGINNIVAVYFFFSHNYVISLLCIVGLLIYDIYTNKQYLQDYILLIQKKIGSKFGIKRP